MYNQEHNKHKPRLLNDGRGFFAKNTAITKSYLSMLIDTSPLSQAIVIHTKCEDPTCCSKKTNPKVLRASLQMDQLIIDRGFTKAPDYVYKNALTKVSIICSEGHKYSTIPSSFKTGSGCPKCSGLCSIEASIHMDQLIIDRGYSKASDYVYINTDTNVSLICPEGHHHSVRPNSFKRGCRCTKCPNMKFIRSSINMEQEIISRGYAKASDYVYVAARVKVSLICPKGHLYSTTPSHFVNGKGCPKCSGLCSIEASKKLDQMIINRGYSKASDYIYVTTLKKVSLICPKGHSCNISPGNFSSGNGCSKCAVSGFNPDKPAILYYLEFFPQPGRSVFKIGITNLSVEKRYAPCQTPYKVVWEKYFNDGTDARNAETTIKRMFKIYRCVDFPVDRLGNSELFDRDILPALLKNF